MESSLHRLCSVIIPVLNESAALRQTLTAMVAEQPLEIIVVDGGSEDETINIAREFNILSINSARGRATQMNAGAQHAQGEYLLFLHADCVIQAGSLSKAIQAINKHGIVAVCFQQHIPVKKVLYRWLEWGNAQRVRLRQMPYGDQGLLIKRETFNQLKGFPDIALMEDWEFAKRLQKLGKIVICEGVIEVNPRRWTKRGVIGQTLRNWCFIICYKLGVSPARLSRWYNNIR